MQRLAALIGLAVFWLATVAWAGPPDEPRVLTDIPELGKPGGELRSLIGRARDTRMLYVFGHARLIGYNADLSLSPDILASYDVQEGRIFTFRLRRGHGEHAAVVARGYCVVIDHPINSPPSALRMTDATKTTNATRS